MNYSSSSPIELEYVVGIAICDAKFRRGLYTGHIHPTTRMPHGEGTMLYEHHPYGLVCYEGEFCNNRKVRGRFYYQDGSSYWGSVNRNEQRHGRGKYVTKDGIIYDGEYKNDIKEGHGRMIWSDGSYYLGEWQNDQWNGQGKLVVGEGHIIHQGLFVNGVQKGEPAEYKPKRIHESDALCYKKFEPENKRQKLSLLVESIFSPKRLVPKKRMNKQTTLVD